MTDINTVTLVGRLTKACDGSFTNSGFCIVNFSIAINRSKKEPDGSYQDRPSFFDCKLLGKRGEALIQYLVKGQQVAIQGYLEQERWESNGQKRSKVVVMVDNLALVGSKPSTQGNQGQSYNNRPQRQMNQPQSRYEDDIPFN